jgi:Asp-tRNA(Asn)/Glu-tRNA(Gln) amidotransferase A subunit family amidase
VARLGVIAAVRDAIASRRISAEEVVRHAFELIERLDGLVPSRLRAAGGIVVGKTNLTEFATEGFTSNLLFGNTRNPWAPDWSTVAAAGFLADGRLTPEEEPGMLASSVYNTEVANMTGLPAISLPAGICANGVPFGLQVMAPRYHDGWLLDLAEVWERERPWPLVAPGYDSFEAALGLSTAR